MTQWTPNLNLNSTPKLTFFMRIHCEQLSRGFTGFSFTLNVCSLTDHFRGDLILSINLALRSLTMFSRWHILKFLRFWRNLFCLNSRKVPEGLTCGAGDGHRRTSRPWDAGYQVSLRLCSRRTTSTVPLNARRPCLVVSTSLSPICWQSSKTLRTVRCGRCGTSVASQPTSK